MLRLQSADDALLLFAYQAFDGAVVLCHVTFMLFAYRAFDGWFASICSLCVHELLDGQFVALMRGPHQGLFCWSARLG